MTNQKTETETKTLFTTRTDLETLRGFFNPISTLVDEINMRITEEGIHVRTMDPSHVALIESRFRAGPCLIDADQIVSARLDTITDALKGMDKTEDVTLTIGEDKIYLIQDSQRYEIPTIEPSTHHTPLPKTPFENLARLDRKGFLKVCRNLAKVSNYVTLTVIDGALVCSGKGDAGSSRQTIHATEPIRTEDPDKTEASYSLDYLIPALKTSIAAEISLVWTVAKPICVVWENTEFYLAPRVEN